jgi:hypothetical protein
MIRPDVLIPTLVSYQHLPGLCYRLDASGGIDRISGDGHILATRNLPDPTDHFPGVDADPDGGLNLPATLRSGGHGGDGSLHAQGAQDGAFGVILMGNRSTEEGQDGIPGILLDDAAVTFDLLCHCSEVLRLEVADLLGIELGGEWGESHQITEQGCD